MFAIEYDNIKDRNDSLGITRRLQCQKFEAIKKIMNKVNILIFSQYSLRNNCIDFNSFTPEQMNDFKSFVHKCVVADKKGVLGLQHIIDKVEFVDFFDNCKDRFIAIYLQN